MSTGVMRTDQQHCFDSNGRVISCLNSSQDGGIRAGAPWPKPRFSDHGDTVEDHLTGLVWTKDAGITVFPLTWWEALTHIDDINLGKIGGHGDWRLPNRKEFFSLLSHVHVNPALPADHPFVNVFSGYYWTSTTCCRLPRQAWSIHMGGARVFQGMKHGSYMVWPVRSATKGAVELPRSGQRLCYDPLGKIHPCAGSGQDGGTQTGCPWPEPRFSDDDRIVKDHLTGLFWAKDASCVSDAVTWESALRKMQSMNSEKYAGCGDWRLPNIRELESLTDMGTHSPALPDKHPFQGVQPYYWSSTTSTYDARYAWVMYLENGSVGVGFKQKPEFFVWGVRGGCPQCSR